MRRNAMLGVLVGALLLALASGAALAATERGTKGDDRIVGTERDDTSSWAGTARTASTEWKATTRCAGTTARTR